MNGPAVKPECEEFVRLTAEYNLVPVYTELTADYETPLSAFAKISEAGEPAFLLESAESSAEAGRYSFLGASPRRTFEAHGLDVKITEVDGSIREIKVDSDPLSELENFMQGIRPAPSNGFAPFQGGAVGYLSYDAVNWFEPTVPIHDNDSLGLPDMFFMITKWVLIFDHRFRSMRIVANICPEDHGSPEAAYRAGCEIVSEVVELLSSPLHLKPASSFLPENELEPQSNTTQEEYCAMVRKAKEYIRAGDIFQVVPSQRFEVPYEGSPVELYRALRHVNPSPYMFCLQFPGNFALVGCSPEVHVRLTDDKVEIRPIAGTRWRGKTEEEDLALERELLNDPKELAEHIMLVDLARNDVGRIADFHSVKVTDLKIIERYSHVMHIVSNIIGRLRAGSNAFDVMRATFPAGTVSGSPKVRAMQIIRELEKNKRCAYAGAVGYFGFDGNLDSCIALRTAVVKEGNAYVQAGAGVVADSVPETEHEECVNKARAMIRAIARAKQLG